MISRVVELIDPVTTQWDEELIRDIFYPVDAARILQIPINFQAFDDFIAWHPSRNGIFSVRTTYHEEWLHKYRDHSPRNLTSTSTPCKQKFGNNYGSYKCRERFKYSAGELFGVLFR